MKEIKKLAGETIIYGLTSIVGRFLNWLLTPLYTFIFLETADLGWVTNIYAYVALLLVMLTYGMETGFFRFASKENESNAVFSTSVISLLSTSTIFVAFILLFSNSIANGLKMPNNGKWYVLIMGITVAIDAFSSIPFAKLRLDHRPIRFAVIKIINIAINISLNLIFFLLIPWLLSRYDNINIPFYIPSFGIGYAFLANLIASVVTLLMLLPYLKIEWKFNFSLWKRMIVYSFPILIVGLTGMVNLNIDKILLPKLLSKSSDPIGQLGIYGACFKLAIVMNMFIQAFRYAFEPFFFSRSGHKDSKEIYAQVMKYFTILSLVIFLSISLFIDWFKLLISPAYWEGIVIIPIVMLGIFFMGIYFNLSLWYKLTDKTKYGAFMGIIGSVITVVGNLILVPIMGYIGSSIALLLCFIIMVIISYLLGQKFYKIRYDLKSFFTYFIVAIFSYLVFYFAKDYIEYPIVLSSILLILFVFFVSYKEKINIYLVIKNK